MGRTLGKQEKFRLAVWRKTRAWAEVYRQQEDGPLLIRSLLLGVENGVRRRTGTMPENEREMPRGAIGRAWDTGQDLAEDLPASISPLLKNSWYPLDDGVDLLKETPPPALL